MYVRSYLIQDGISTNLLASKRLFPCVHPLACEDMFSFKIWKRKEVGVGRQCANSGTLSKI